MTQRISSGLPARAPERTLRDYFAAHAMQGYLAGSRADGTTVAVSDLPVVARYAYAQADAMLKARELRNEL